MKFTEAIRVAPLLSRWVLSVLSLLRRRCRKSRCQHESITHRSAPWVPDLLTLASSTQATSGMVIRGVPALGQAVGQGLLVDINGQTKKCEHGGFSLAAEQWRGGRGIAVGERVVEQEATTTAGKNAGPTAPMSPILRRRRTGANVPRRSGHLCSGCGYCTLFVACPARRVTTCQYGQMGHC